MGVYRLRNTVGGLPAGTVVTIQGTATPTDIPDGQVAALRGGLPAGAGIFNPTTNVFKIRSDTYTGPLHPDTTAIVSELVSQISTRNGGNATMNTTAFNADVWLVDPATPTIKVEFKKWENALAGNKSPDWDSLTASIPWPWNATPTAGTDRAIVLYRPDTRELWEFWKVRPRPGRPGSDDYYNAPYDVTIGGEIQASQVGYIADAGLNRGVFDDIGNQHYGTSATSISYAGSAISIADVQAGEIDHAIAVQVTNARRSSEFYFPAMRSDGGDPNCPIREGQRFRFPASLDVDALPGLNGFSRMVARAIRKYGCIVTDKAGTVAFTGENGGVAVQSDGMSVNPWRGIYDALGAGLHNYDVLRNMPWNLLQAMPADYGEPS